jgi:hypothetical protein
MENTIRVAVTTRLILLRQVDNLSAWVMQPVKRLRGVLEDVREINRVISTSNL